MKNRTVSLTRRSPWQRCRFPDDHGADWKMRGLKKERRQSKRVEVFDAVSTIVMCADKPIDGRLHDISAQGLSIAYEGPRRVWGGKPTEVTLFVDALESAFAEKVRCIPVYDMSNLDHNQSFSGKLMRICGMKTLAVDDDNALEKLLLLMDKR